MSAVFVAQTYGVKPLGSSTARPAVAPARAARVGMAEAAADDRSAPPVGLREAAFTPWPPRRAQQSPPHETAGPRRARAARRPHARRPLRLDRRGRPGRAS